MLAAALSLSLVASAWFVPAVEARAMVQGKRAQQLPLAEAELSAALGSDEGRGRLRDEVAKELAQYLYAMISEPETDGGAGADESVRYPLYSAETKAERSPRTAARARQQPMPFRKKAMGDDQKQIRFHQCYFNPISCFRK